MLRKLPMIAVAAALATVPALAQQAAAPPQPSDPARELPYDRGYDKHDARHDAVDAVEKPVTDALNDQAKMEASTGVAATEVVNANNQAQYEADMAEYRARFEASQSVAMADHARYQRQQRAYADAMVVWRENNRACERGVLKACKRPTPDPRDFY